MALVGHISGSTQTNSQIGITGSVVIANRPAALFPTLPADVSFYVSGSSDGTNKSVFGGGVVVSGSFSQGLTTIASGVYSHAEGRISVSHGAYSHAEGYFGASRGTYSHAEGSTAIALGQSSHAEGESSTASGGGSHAEGGATAASGDYSHTEGYGSIASAYGSHAEGGSSKAQGAYAHAEGYFTVALGSPSHAEGGYTIASGNYQHADGRFNLRNNDHSILVIGNGTGTSDAARSDIVRVEMNSFQVTGSVTQRNSGSSAVGFMGNEAGVPSSMGSDVFFYVSGSTGDTSNSKSLFGGDLIVSGNLRVTSGISGSLTRLTNGTSYLAAGSNITIVSSSTGQVTISSAGGGGGSPAGTGNEIQYNNAGSFGGSVNYKFNGTVKDTVILSGSFAQGSGSFASASYSHAEGYSTIATGIYSHAEGELTLASSDYAHAEGKQTTASGVGSHSEGGITNATGEGAHSEGYNNTASGLYAHSEGYATLAFGNYSHAEGSNTIARGILSHAEGRYTIASGNYQHVDGRFNLRNNDHSYLVIGNGSGDADALRSDIIRVESNNVQFTGSLVQRSITATQSTISFMGNDTGFASTRGTDLFMFVSGSTAATRANVAAFGGYVWISGSLVQGNFSVSGGATGQYARAHGERTTASGASSHSEGRFALAQGANSHAEGDSTVTYGAGSHAEGLDSAAFAAYSHAEGRSTEARGLYSHAEGYDSIPRADYSHAEGRDTQVLAAGLYAHAEGSGSIAIGEASHAEGLGTLASGSYQLAVGKYNTRDNTSSLFVVGNGTSDSAANRSDIFRVEQSSVQVTGSFVSTLGLSGSLTKLANGSSYLVAGSNVTITSASNGSVTISSTGGGGGGTNYLRFLAGTVTSTAASGSMESVGMDYLSSGLVGATTYTFEAILATTAGTTAYIDLYDYSGVINGTPGPIAGSVLTGSSQSYTYLSANVTSQFSLAGGPGIIEARVWCTPNGSGLNAICKNAKLKVE